MLVCAFVLVYAFVLVHVAVARQKPLRRARKFDFCRAASSLCFVFFACRSVHRCVRTRLRRVQDFWRYWNNFDVKAFPGWFCLAWQRHCFGRLRGSLVSRARTPHSRDMLVVPFTVCVAGCRQLEFASFQGRRQTQIRRSRKQGRRKMGAFGAQRTHARAASSHDSRRGLCR